MIVLWGLAGDTPLAVVRTQLAAMRRNAVLLDQRAVLETRVEIAFDDEPHGWLELGALRIDLARVTAIYLRPYDPDVVPEVASAGRDSPARVHALAVHEALRLWTELTQARVVNRLSAMSSNGSKPYQAELIRAAGFAVPETLITTDPEAARAFCDRHDEVIYKSVSSVRSVVSRVTPERREQLDAVRTCPTQFQRRVPGTDVRVHVVGDELFASQIVSTADDYRYARRQGADATLLEVEAPRECADRCRELAARLGLPFAGIDLRRTPDGEWVCFEVNPSPGFTFFDHSGRIARSVAALLASARPRREERPRPPAPALVEVS